MLALLTTVALGLVVLYVLAFVVVPVVWSLLFAQAEARRARDTSGQPTWDPAPAPVAGQTAVVLIHGTFAPRARWTLADSPLSQALAADCQVVRFNWSGANSMHSRRRASERLRTCIDELAAAGCEHVALVAHSHGGNIALKACELPATAARVAAIVCLATPFISAWRPRARRVQPGVRPGLVVLVLMLLLMVPGAVGLPSYFTLMDRLGRPAADPADAALLLAYVAVGLLLAWLVARQFDTAGADAAASQDIAGSVCNPAAIAPLADRTLIVTAGGDEADGGLKIASALNRSLVASNHWRPTRPGEVRPAVEQVEGGSVGARIGRRLLVAITHVPAAIANLAFGADGRSLGANLFLTSSEIPVGVWQHWHVDGAGRPDETTMAHSSLYDDPRVIARVLAWIHALRRGPSSLQSPPAADAGPACGRP